MIIYYSELAKLARKIFGKGLQSKRLREIKKKQSKKNAKKHNMAPSEQSQRGKFLVTGSSEQKAKSDKKKTEQKKTKKNNNYNILLRASKASEENFWLSYCRVQNQLKDG